MNAISRPFRFVWILGIAVLAASAVGAGWILHVPSTGAVGLADTGKESVAPRRGTETVVVCFGQVDLEEGILPLNPLQQGRVIEVPVKENQTVEAGTILLRLDDEAARLKVTEAEAAVREAKAFLAEAKRGPEQHAAKLAAQRNAIDMLMQERIGAKAVVDIAQRMVKAGSANQDEAAAKEAQVKKLDAAIAAEQEKLKGMEKFDPQDKITQAEAAVERTEALLKQAQHAVKEYVLRAPVAGTVQRQFAHKGDLAGPQAPRPAVQFAPRGPRIIRAEVEQEFADRVQEGMAVTIQDHATGRGNWTGKVTRLADNYASRRSLQEPFQFNDVRTLECLITLDPEQPPLRLNQRVRVTIGKGRASSP